MGVTRLVPDRVGVDFSIDTAPQVVADGLYPVAARLGPSIPLEIGRDVFLIPSAGVTGIAFPGSHEWQGTSGWYCGGAAVLARGSVGFRAGVTFLGEFGAPPQLWLAEIGVMHVPLPRRAR